MEKLDKKYDFEKDIDKINEVCIGLIGVALVSVSEVVGWKMIIRIIHHIL